MEDKKELVLYTLNAKNKDQENVLRGLLSMFYHAAFTNKIGIAELEDGPALVGIEAKEGEEVVYYPLAKIMSAEDVEASLGKD